ncbi:MAG: hypothetical protein AMXMBFR74_11990 [Parvibaculum sp.]
MVSLEEDIFEAGKRHPRQTVEHGFRLEPPVDIISKENQKVTLRRARTGIGLDLAEQTREQIVAAMNVADGINPHALGYGRGLAALKRTLEPVEQSADHAFLPGMPAHAAPSVSPQ